MPRSRHLQPKVAFDWLGLGLFFPATAALMSAVSFGNKAGWTSPTILALFGLRKAFRRGALAAVPCVSQTAYMKCAECVDEVTCGVRLAMKEVRDATADILDHTTLADVNAKVARKRRK